MKLYTESMYRTTQQKGDQPEFYPNTILKILAAAKKYTSLKTHDGPICFLRVYYCFDKHSDEAPLFDAVAKACAFRALVGCQSTI